MTTHWIDPSQVWLTCETRDIGYEIAIKPWNPY